MSYRRNLMKQLLAFALALGVFGLPLSCMAICAEHAEQSFSALEEVGATTIEQADDCCSLNTIRSLPAERVQKTPAGHLTRPLSLAEIFGVSRRTTLNIIDKVPQPADSPPLQGISPLRI
jgi:hypothetical protein